MKRTLGFARDIMICFIIAVFMVGVYFGAVLQESYKLAPVTAAEVME